MQLMAMKRRKQCSVQKIRLMLIAIIAVQFPHMMCFVSSQISAVLNDDAEFVVSQTFQDIDFTNVTALDIMARKAMRHLHDDLDRDDDGNVSITEGAQFIDQEEFVHSSGTNLPGFATDKDGRITAAEFWDNWVNSSVHDWTVLQMVDWLSNDVDLPQYADKFKQYQISGPSMPILASNSSLILTLVDGVNEHRLKLWLKAMEITLCGYSDYTEFSLLKRLAIQGNSHRRKIQLRATEIVLFGLPKSKSTWFKDILLTISILLALAGLAFGVRVRQNAAVAMATMQKTLSNLQNEIRKMEEVEDDDWMKSFSSNHEGNSTLNRNTEHSSSTSSLESESTLYSRLNEALEELTDTKMMLEQAEERLIGQQQWSPPSKLIACLKNTHHVEWKLHELKREQAQKKVEQAKSQFQKMKKKSSIFSSVHFIHSAQVDSFDIEVQDAKDLLREIQRDSQEYKKRWLELESICKCNFSSKHYTTDFSRVTSRRDEKKRLCDQTSSKVESNNNNSTEIHQSESMESRFQSSRRYPAATDAKHPISCAASIRSTSQHKDVPVIPEDKVDETVTNLENSSKWKKNDSLQSYDVTTEGIRGNSSSGALSLEDGSIRASSILHSGMKSSSIRSLPDLSVYSQQMRSKTSQSVKYNNGDVKQPSVKRGLGSMLKRKKKKST